MINVRHDVRSEEVRNDAGHVLFIEGASQDAIDPKVLNSLFSSQLRIEPLGPSFSVKSVAEALHPHHPTYYFLIDRDHHDDDFVERYWENFPDPETHNLLMWKRREIENYFLEPEYLVSSMYCKVNEAELGRKVLQFANDRLFLDVVNYVVITIREELKKNWIEKFSNPGDFTTKESALSKLLEANEFEERRKNVKQMTSTKEVKSRFEGFLDRMTGGKQEKLDFGQGDWLRMIQGKKVLSQVINSNCFEVIANDGSYLTGKEKLNTVVKDLLGQNQIPQPQDFMTLRDLITSKIKRSA